MEFTWFELLWYFMIYAVIGWCTEVAFAAVHHGKFVNRGFLNGPVCPIYGVGVTVVILCLTPIKDNLIILFVGSVVLTSFLEWLTGFVLEKVFHDKWWDYSDVPFNIGGYICLKFSLLWGLACVFVMVIVQPIIEGFVNGLYNKVGWTIIIICLVLFVSDAIVTVTTILKLNKRLGLISDMTDRLRELSDSVGENLSGGVMELAERGEKIKEKFDDSKRKEEWDALLEKHKKLIASKKFGHKRLLKAFPNFASIRHSDALEGLKKYYREKTKK